MSRVIGLFARKVNAMELWAELSFILNDVSEEISGETSNYSSALRAFSSPLHFPFTLSMHIIVGRKSIPESIFTAVVEWWTHFLFTKAFCCSLFTFTWEPSEGGEKTFRIKILFCSSKQDKSTRVIRLCFLFLPIHESMIETRDEEEKFYLEKAPGTRADFSLLLFK